MGLSGLTLPHRVHTNSTPDVTYNIVSRFFFEIFSRTINCQC